MSIIIKSEKEIATMRQAGKIVAMVLEVIKQQVKPGIKTEELDTTAAAGVWYGPTTDQFNNTEDIMGVISTNGQLRFIVNSGSCAGSQYKGTISLNGAVGSGNVTGYAVPGCVFSNGTSITSGTITFTLSGSYLTGSYSMQGDTGTFNLSYDSIAETPITLADLEGHWGYDYGPTNFFDINVSSNGSITATGSTGCYTTGKISIIDPDWSITKISVTASNCNDSILNGTYSGLGLLVFDATGDKFYLMASKSNLSYFDIVMRLP